MDALDEQILGILRADGRASFTAIGHEVGLSTNAVAARVRRLRTVGVIAGFTVVLADAQPDPAAGMEAFIDVRLHQDRDSEEFLTWVRRVSSVVDAVHVTGPYDYLLRVRVRDMPALDRLLRALKRDGGVMQTQTRMALR
ncbi:Lrp/AsnC family transcriptional regulator [Polymorphospora sp. NPDC050346]|uniref:Lrp/AsnC family transcriptional regulator n=1 Tax=Polymorphospora sp. NPDC050346 TaxID=3155780 RepID=UPI0033DA9A58